MGSELDYRVVDGVGGYTEYLRNEMSLELKIGDVPLEKEVRGVSPYRHTMAVLSVKCRMLNISPATALQASPVLMIITNPVLKLGVSVANLRLSLPSMVHTLILFLTDNQGLLHLGLTSLQLPKLLCNPTLPSCHLSILYWKGIAMVLQPPLPVAAVTEMK